MILLPALGPREVQVRLVSLALDLGELVRLKGFLTEEEIQRGNRLLDQMRRERFFTGRGMLRELLAGYLGEEPESIRISEGEFGKLHLSDHQEAGSVCFNLSHAGDYVLFAFAAGREVGVDMEQVRQDLPFSAIAERYFSLREKGDLFSLPSGEQIEAFYRCWTRKEAYLKGAGTGFTQPSNGFDVSVLPHHPPALIAHRGKPGEIGRWSIRDIEMPEGYCAAVAVEGYEAEVRTVRLPHLHRELSGNCSFLPSFPSSSLGT